MTLVASQIPHSVCVLVCWESMDLLGGLRPFCHLDIHRRAPNLIGLLYNPTRTYS